jgi:hypothetical protein
MPDDRDARIAELEAELHRSRSDADAWRMEAERGRRALSEVLEQQTATAGVLRVIAASPTDAQRVIDAIIETAARL